VYVHVCSMDVAWVCMCTNADTSLIMFALCTSCKEGRKRIQTEWNLQHYPEPHET